ncbi:MAG: CHAT domain-containing protein [Chloroflexota bacterium]
MSIQINQDNNTKPVIFLAFANPTAGSQGYLRNLGEEARQLENVIRQAQSDNLCELVIKPYAGLADIVEVFQEYRNRIAIFHYAGHAKNFMLMLEDTGDNAASNTGEHDGTTMIDGRGLAAFLGEQNSLQLVFLNACSTQPQVDELLNANVPAVIATSQAIRDDVATTLATHFYQSLTSGANLQKAFNEAEGLAQALLGKGSIGKGSVRDAYFEDDAGVAMTEFYDWPWRLTIKQGAEQLAEWSLGDAANEPLFGLPPLPEHDLPDRPFRHLNFFTEQDAEIFFGRGHQIRNLYDLVTMLDSAPIILFYGASGVGKSSMLAAGLLPRLQQQTIHYVRRNQGLGLTGTLAQVLWDGETVPDSLDAGIIAKRWHELEQIPDTADRKPTVMILDQVEEVFTRPNREQPHELADFFDVLSALFAHRSHRPQGKLILGFRKEWLADIEDAMKVQRLPRTKLFLSRLTRAGIIEAVTGVARSTRLQTNYRLTTEAGLAEIVANDLLEDPDSPVAPTLQILLTKMWAEAEKVNFDQPHFGIAHYQSLKREGLLLSDFLHQQLDKLHAWRADVVDSGLALDLLAAHTTPQGTVDHHTESELLDMYRHIERDIPPLVQKCEELYLLFNPGNEQADQPKSSRLAHDALASLTRHQYEESDKPGQRARRILDTRVVEWIDESGQPIEGNPLDETDLTLVEAGLNGTRDLTALERQLLEASRIAQVQREHDRKMQRHIPNVLFTLMAVVAVVAFFLWRQSVEQTQLVEEQRTEAEAQTVIANRQTELVEEQRLIAEAQSRRALAQNLASQSQLLIQVDDDQSDLPLILARDAAMTDLNLNTSRALRIALERDSLSQKPFSLPNLHHQASVRHAVYSPDGQTVASASWDGTIRLWSADMLAFISLLYGHRGPVRSVSYSPDGRHIVSGGDDTTVRIWDVASGEQLTQFDGHSDKVRTVSYSPDGKHIVSGGEDRTVRIWDVVSGEQLIQFNGHGNYVLSVSYSPDGKHIVSGSGDDTVRIWDVASGEQVMQLDGHTEPVLSVSYSPDGTHIVSGSDDKTVRIWDVASGKQVMQLDGHSGSVWSVSYSPDGTHIVSGSGDNTMRIWDVASGEQLTQFDGHSGWVSSVSYSPDGRHIVSGSGDKTVRIWEVASGKQVSQSDGHSNWVNAVSYSPDRRHIVSGGDTTVRIWDVASGKQLARFDGHSGGVRTVSYSPDGTHIVSGSVDKTVRIWDIASGEQVTQFDGHTSSVLSVSYSPDGTHIVSGSRDNTVRIWDIASGEQLAQFDGQSDVLSVSYSPDGTHIVSGSFDKTVRIWDIASGEQLAQFDGHTDWVNSVSYSPDGTHIVSGSRDGTVRIWDVASGEQVAQFDGQSDVVLSVSYSPDGRHIVSGNGDGTIHIWTVASDEQVTQFDGQLDDVRSVSYSPDGRQIVSGGEDNTVRIWDVASGEQLIQFDGHSNWVLSVSYSPDGKHIVSGGSDKTVRIWDVASGNQVTQFDGHSSPVLSVSYSPDGTHIVSGSEDKTVRIWDVASGEQLTQFDGHSDRVWSVSYSPDGRHVVSGSEDNTVRIWDVSSSEQVAQFDGHLKWVTSVSYSPDGRYIVSASGDETVRIWDVASSEQVRQFDGHSNTVESVFYSPDGRHIVSGSRDNTVRIWDVASGEQVAQFDGHSDWVNSVSYSPDGRYIVSGSRDNTVRIWETPQSALLRSVVRVSRPAPILTHAELSQLGIGNDGLLPNRTELKPLMVEAQAQALVEEGHVLARAGETVRATEKFEEALTTIAPLDKDALMLPTVFDIDPMQKAIDVAVSTTIHEGNRLARNVDVVSATHKFAEAVALDPSLTVEPETEAKRIAASVTKQAGERLARAGEIISATLKFEEAMALNPSLAIEPASEAKRLAAQIPSLTVGTRVTATTKSIPDWRFTGTVGQIITISLIDTEDGSFNPYLRLYDANGKMLAEDDDSGGGSDGYDALIQEFVLPETGTYFVRAGRANSSVVYELVVRDVTTVDSE